MSIQAIETEYKGYKFRSRLEARWAVFFDELGIKWEYEPEGFDFGDGIYYLPDFHLCDIDVYVEIKSFGAIGIEDEERGIVFVSKREFAHKYAVAAREISKNHLYAIFVGDPIDAISGDECGYLFSMCECLGKTISLEDENFTCADGERCRDCARGPFLVSWKIQGFVENKILVFSSGSNIKFLPNMESVYVIVINDLDPENPRAMFPPDSNDENFLEYTKMNGIAMKKARQARFEHGANPCREMEISR